MNRSTPLNVSAVLLAAAAVVGVSAVGVSQSPFPQGPTGKSFAPKPNQPQSADARSADIAAQVSGLDSAIAATNRIGGASLGPETGTKVAEKLQQRVGAAGEMIGFAHYDASGTQTITLVHAGKAWMAVYHIDRSGKIRLVSSRPIDADFSLQLNATSPLPEEIREIGSR